MLENTKKIKGQLSVFEVSDKGTDKLLYESKNLTTVGFPVALSDLFSNTLKTSKPSDFSIGYMQFGNSYNVNYVDRNFYQLSAPLTISQYGKFTNLDLQTEEQLIVDKPFLETSALTYTTQPSTFIKLGPEQVTVIGDKKLFITVSLDEHTANDISLSEMGLFLNNIIGGEVVNPSLIAYKAFGINDGVGIPISFSKNSETRLIFQWIISLDGGEFVEPLTFSTSSNTFLDLKADVYLPQSTNTSGNSWVCYFPDVVDGKGPPTVSSSYTLYPRKNITKDFAVRLLNRGIGIIACDYNYPTTLGDYPIITSGTGSNIGITASSLSPLTLSGDVRNAYTDAAGMAQFAKYITSSVGFTTSNVAYVGEGFGGTLAAWLTYAPEFSSTTASTFYKQFSTRALGMAVKDAPLAWDRYWPLRLGSSGVAHDLTVFAIPKQLSMSGTVYAEGGNSVEQLSSSDRFQGSWCTSGLPADATFQSVSASFGYTDSDLSSTTMLYWSSIPGLKNTYQYVELPTSALQWWSPRNQASGTGAVDTTYPHLGVIGHVDNSSTYFHVDYSGSSLSGLTGSAIPGVTTLFRVASGTDIKQVASTGELAFNLDNATLSGTGANNEWFASSFSNANKFNADSTFSACTRFQDPFFGHDLWHRMSGTGDHATSSTFRYADPNQYKNAVSNFDYPNTNEAAISAKARSEWLVLFFANYDSWYDQFI